MSFDDCKDYPEHEGIVPVVEAWIKSKGKLASIEADHHEVIAGSVYLIRVGRNYKIGMTANFGKRSRALKLQLPDPHILIHEITTDDIDGIEKYRQRRFASKRLGGEFFALTRW